jgi:Holliday junction resolvase RusA-like endonuclease
MQARTYMLTGEPIPLARARYGKFNNIYDSQKNAKLVLGITLQALHGDKPLFSGPIAFDAIFYFQTPKRSKTKTGTYYAGRPDADNLLKFYADISNGIIFKDDSQIVRLSAIKVYDETPRTIFTITPLGPRP